MKKLMSAKQIGWLKNEKKFDSFFELRKAWANDVVWEESVFGGWKQGVWWLFLELFVRELDTW
jgi:hypothetical protein